MKIKHCPHCNVDLRKESIYEYFLNRYEGDIKKARKVASEYGGDGYFYNIISIYDRNRDKTVGYRCLNCSQSWERE